ncbi:MAG: serine/threonine protein kinase [Deltaproteobacteria bacterium]|nr:serine/threonine protein kinase [Deltaproteobacteria bacterium]
MLLDAYEITADIGHGGMGGVFAARRVSDGLRVAIKLLRPETRFLPDATERLRREAIAASRIRSKHVAQVIEVLDDPTHGTAVVFEYLEGETLEDRLKRDGQIPLKECRGLVEQMLVGLAEAHDEQIIHRDLKPGNIFLERRADGTISVKVLDFGVVKLPTQEGFEVLTQRWQSLGTFSYMPPEQIRTPSKVDARADLYACGAVIFRMLTGQPPHRARSVGDLILQKRSQPARKLNAVLPAKTEPLPASVEEFVDKLLAMEPHMRYQSARQALEAWRLATVP